MCAPFLYGGPYACAMIYAACVGVRLHMAMISRLSGITCDMVLHRAIVCRYFGRYGG